VRVTTGFVTIKMGRVIGQLETAFEPVLSLVFQGYRDTHIPILLLIFWGG
jgi:hypothetical protein